MTEVLIQKTCLHAFGTFTLTKQRLNTYILILPTIFFLFQHEFFLLILFVTLTLINYVGNWGWPKEVLFVCETSISRHSLFCKTLFTICLMTSTCWTISSSRLCYYLAIFTTQIQKVNLSPFPSTKKDIYKHCCFKG